MKNSCIDQIDQAIKLAIDEGLNNILIVYRSNFADLSKDSFIIGLFKIFAMINKIGGLFIP